MPLATVHYATEGVLALEISAPANQVALIPLRGGSKSIPKKNIRLIAGKPLCAWVIEAAVGCERFRNVYVSTDSQEIADVVQQLGLGVRVIHRPSKYATDTATTESVMLHFMQYVDFEQLVTIQATSPLLESRDLRHALDQFHAEQLDSLLSAVRTKRFFWNDDATPMNYDPLHRPRRQDFRGTLMENGAFYVTHRTILQQLQCRLGGRVGVYEMDESSAVEIDEPHDWQVVERALIARTTSQK
jgi:CMP-N-acetylneuraminic acid synthetase